MNFWKGKDEKKAPNSGDLLVAWDYSRWTREFRPEKILSLQKQQLWETNLRGSTIVELKSGGRPVWEKRTVCKIYYRCRKQQSIH